jgi:hypothetical protein
VQPQAVERVRQRSPAELEVVVSGQDPGLLVFVIVTPEAHRDRV